MKSSHIEIALISSRDTDNNKIKAVIIISQTKDSITVLNISNNYLMLDQREQAKYYEITEYNHTGLDILSWVDVTKSYTISRDKLNIIMVGKLQQVDVNGINDFKKDYDEKRALARNKQFKDILKSIIDSY